MTETPDKYTPEPRKYEQKDWLYQEYWGKFKSVHQIADECDTAHSQVRESMVELGIPRRVDRFTRDNAVSAFTGFYRDVPSRSDGKSNQQFQADYDGTQDDSDWMYGWRGVCD